MALTRFGLRWGRRAWRLVLLAAPLALSSCGDGGAKLYPVHGQVFYEGKPAGGAVVFFHPQGGQAPAADDPPGEHSAMADMPMSKVGPDGSFELKTSNRGRGAPAGRYAVTVLWTGPSAAADDGEGPTYLPARYCHPATSGLAAEVKEGDNQLPPIQLTR